jgi:tetratricopeptide (TPR) repeat protein
MKVALPDSPKARFRLSVRAWVCLVLIAGVFVALVAGVYKLRHLPPVAVTAPPVIDLKGYDPQIVAAIDRARAALALAPRSADAWGKLGSVLMVHKFDREALSCFAEAERQQRNEPRWPYLQGMILLASSPDAALPKLIRGAELAGEEPPAPRLRVAHLLIERGRLAEAEKHLQAVVRAHPDEPHVLLGMGKLELARERLPEALKYLERSAASAQTAHASTALIATIQQRLGNNVAADEASRRLATMPPDPAMPDLFAEEAAAFQTGLEVMLTRADRLLKQRMFKEALALNEKAVAAYPDSATAWRMLGQARIEAKNYTGAEKALRKALEIAPQESESHFQLGSALFFQNNVSEATDCFRRSTEITPNYAPAHFNLGACLAAQEKRVEAIEAFRTAIHYDPAFADAHRRLGATLALEGRFDEALQPLRRAVELNPEDSAAARMLERAAQRAGEKQAESSPVK